MVTNVTTPKVIKSRTRRTAPVADVDPIISSPVPQPTPSPITTIDIDTSARTRSLFFVPQWKLLSAGTVTLGVLFATVYGGYHLWGGLNTSVASTAASALHDLSTMVILPSEAPSLVATVSDATVLSGQPFYHNAHNGDMLFVYNSTHQAYLYRPTQHIIVNVAPVADTATSTSTNTQTIVPTASTTPVSQHPTTHTTNRHTPAKQTLKSASSTR